VIGKMDKKSGIGIVSVTILVLCFAGTASATNWSVDGSGGADFTRIQDAINNASAGDTILVYSGVYYENVVLGKSVTLKGNGQPVVDANGSDTAITLTADEITLVGFNATNSLSSWGDVGIKVTSNNNNIAGNNVSNNWCGIILYDPSNNNTITGNNVSNNNGGGILLSYSSNNTITGNNVSNNSLVGIFLASSSNNRIRGNNVSNHDWNGICLDNSSNNNRITGNNVSNNGCGIGLSYSSNNIYLNNFINNTDNVFSYTPTNIWNSPLEITYTYDGNAYTNYVGNYWDDYEGIDADGDGIGDTHYSIYPESDGYPLMKPFENYILS
jgi:parallel beta-helix repeat protein